MTLCQRLKRKRRERRLRQEDVAQYLGFKSKNAYGSIENGRTKLRVEHLQLLAQLFNVSTEELLNGTY